jgi:hypothetical protein
MNFFLGTHTPFWPGPYQYRGPIHILPRNPSTSYIVSLVPLSRASPHARRCSRRRRYRPAPRILSRRRDGTPLLLFLDVCYYVSREILLFDLVVQQLQLDMNSEASYFSFQDRSVPAIMLWISRVSMEIEGLRVPKLAYVKLMRWYCRDTRIL